MRGVGGAREVKEDDRYVEDNKMEAPFVMTCCGSLTKATLRMASHTPADGNNKVTAWEA